MIRGVLHVIRGEEGEEGGSLGGGLGGARCFSRWICGVLEAVLFWFVEVALLTFREVNFHEVGFWSHFACDPDLLQFIQDSIV